MLFYYDCYARREQYGAEGFAFLGDRWPQGISTDMSDLRGVGMLWQLISNVFGDHGTQTGSTHSRFFLRDCFGDCHATVAGIVTLRKDRQGRIGTRADFVVCLPVSPQELTLELDPDVLFRDLQNAHAPGSQANYRADTLCRPRQAVRNAPKALLDAAFRQSFLAPGPLILPTASEEEAYQTAVWFGAMRPAGQRRRFSFLTWAVDWRRLCELPLSLIAVAPAPMLSMQIADFARQFGYALYSVEGADKDPAPLPGNAAPDGLAYLKRIYPTLLQNGDIDLPEQCADWAQQALLPDDPKLARPAAMAFGLMLQAARAEKYAYYPLAEEKAALGSALHLEG